MFVMYVDRDTQEQIPYGDIRLYTFLWIRYTGHIYVMCVVRDFQIEIISKGILLCMEMERHIYVIGVEKHLLSWVT
jgi:hypothetical protein